MFSVLLFEIPSLQSSNRCAHLHESHRTLRDGSLGWRCPRHFVPGYDRTVPPGHFATGSPKELDQCSLIKLVSPKSETAGQSRTRMVSCRNKKRSVHAGNALFEDLV